jgi:hypothetical protein
VPFQDINLCRGSLERFSNTYTLNGIIEGGFYLHPNEQKSLAGDPAEKKRLGSIGFGVSQLENRYNSAPSQGDSRQPTALLLYQYLYKRIR